MSSAFTPLQLLLCYKRQLTAVIVIGTLLILSGCATYGSEAAEAKRLTANGDYLKAKAHIQKTLSPTGDDALLYHMELSIIEHLAGNFHESNKLLDRAEQLSDEYYTQRLSDALQVMMTSPRSGPYRGAIHERVLIHYFKAMNYFQLADQATEAGDNRQRESYLEAVRIESRRADIVLQDLEAQKGTYAEAADEKSSIFKKLMRIFDVLNGNYQDKDKLVYRQDAWVNYMMGLNYEKNTEWDDARISYQKAAELYESGYQEQYELSKEMTQQAWIDTVRMMKKAGWERWEWKRLARKKKFSEETMQKLEKMDEMAELVIIDHLGFSPEIKEMNLLMNLEGEDLTLYPVPTGTPSDQDDQFAWFFMQYADTGIISIIQNYNRGGLGSSMEGMISTKNFGIAPTYEIAEAVGLVSTLSASPVRVTVPYMSPLDKSAPLSNQLIINGKDYAMYRSESIAHIALYNLLINADKELQLAVARESLKAVLAQKVATLAAESSDTAQQFGQLLSFAASAFSASLAKAETRSWLFLPYEVRVRRIMVEPGQHDISLQLTNPGPQDQPIKERHIDVAAGDVFLWKNRQFK